MIIATWNVFNGTTEARVSELKTTCDADIMTFQETRFSEGPNTVWRGDPGKTNKGVSVWCQYDFQTVQPNAPVSPSIAIRIENSPLGKLNILNLWAKPNPDYYSDLMNSLKAYDDFIKSDPTIIMGDFNISPRIKRKVTQFKTLNKHLETEYGLTSAYHNWHDLAFGDEPDATLYFRWKETSVFHCDFIYVPKGLAKDLKSVSVPGFEHFSTSDHRPVICEFEGG